MNWIKENKFLFGFLVIMVIGTGVLTYLLLGAKSTYDDAQSSFEEKAAELKRLQTLPIFPSQKNLDKLTEQKKQMSEAVNKLGQNLAAEQIEAEDTTPEKFQDQLRASVSAVKEKAARTSAKLTQEKFFLGFDKYETAPPDREASTALARELKAIEGVVNLILDARISELKSLNREDLPEEKSKEKKDEKKPANAGKGPKETKRLVVKHPFDLAFTCDQANLKQILNGLVSYKGQFFIPRLVTIKNQAPTGPPKALPGPGGAAPVPAAGGAGANAALAPAGPKIIVGDEKIDVTLYLEMVDFAEVAAK